MQEARADFSTWKRLYFMGWKYPGRFLLMLALTAAFAGLTAYLIIVLDQILGFFSHDDESVSRMSTAEKDQVVSQMKWLSLQLLVLAPLCAGTAYAAVYTGQWLANQVMVNLRRGFIEHLIELDLSFHSQLAKGDLFNRMSGDMQRTQSLMNVLYGKLQQHPFEIAAMFGVLFYINWILAAILLATVLPLLLFIGKSLKRTYRRSKKARQEMADTIVTFEQITSGIRVIKAMGSQEAEAARFDQNNNALFHANMRVARARGQSEAGSSGLAYFVTCTALFTGALAFQYDYIAPKEILIFLVAVGRIAVLSRTSQRVMTQALDYMSSAVRILGIMDLESNIKNKENSRPCPNPPRDAIRFQDVDFAYNDGSEQVLNRLSLDIPIGRSLALVGESGAGKSTMLDLIPRFYDVSSGSITLDGIDIREFELEQYIHLFAIVQQDSFLFNDTVYNNIAYGRPGASQDDIEAAARRAHVHDTILDLEGGLGYQTVVGDRGERLSGGQRQRVAIARALLRDAPILLLDEPTSALDSESERHVQQALKELMAGRTSIIIAHRLSTIKDADCIALIDKSSGQVAELGTHQELIKMDGAYAALVRMQDLGSGETTA